MGGMLGTGRLKQVVKWWESRHKGVREGLGKMKDL